MYEFIKYIKSARFLYMGCNSASSCDWSMRCLDEKSMETGKELRWMTGS